jgi:hypothetical protein
MRPALWLTISCLALAAPALRGAEPCAGCSGCGACGYTPPVAGYAHPSDTGRYVGYYVGGGVSTFRKGEARCPNEGTWGWDYCGFGLVPRHIALLWSHGGKNQGGTGGYRTDGKPVKNIFAFPPPHVEEAGGEHCRDGHK